ncbi:related to methyltransferase [Cephalotrichum gorgonifer]|uniref:Related to methyltransferase n=1 Tax=Cephalotrichum gorgonifer TaxID=2041049 RepID=A0AAE8N6W4_9PEZI|nr:related to methyltransferase [Cephalotrichum gorgonifer]
MTDPVKSPSPPAAVSTSPPAATTSPRSESTTSPTTQGPLVADENPEEEDLGIEDNGASETTSLRSSILKYRVENGRTYHAYKDGSYVLPNDEAENERLDLQHTIFLLTWDGNLHVAPLQKEVHRVLDAGCGTGIWSVEFADEHPEAQVTGIDLSPIQPSFVPPNCTFYVDDLEDDWTFSTPFDFVFARFMTGSILNFPRFFKQSYDNLNSGGVIELQDIIYPMCSDDGTLTEDTPLKRWSDLLNEAFRGNGRAMDTALFYKEQLADAGFVDIHTVEEKWPTNHWPRDPKYKQIGIWNQENILNALQALSLAIFTRPKEQGGLGWTAAELELLLVGVRKDMKDRSIHGYWRIHAIYARKP